MTIYYPELGEKRATTAIVKTFHVIRDTYAARWALEDDAAVRALFKSLRIRPRRIEQNEMIHGGRQWSALLTGAAQSKLCHRGDVAHEMLLD